MKTLSVLLLVALLAQSPTRQKPGSAHPLDPLSAGEIGQVTAALGQAGRLSAPVRVVTIELAEPSKPPSASARVARAVLYDWSTGATTEQTVDLRRGMVSAPTVVATGDPPVRRVIINRATEIALSDQRMIDALRKRGVTALDRVSFIALLGEGRNLPKRGSATSLGVAPIAWDGVGEAAGIPGLFARVDLAGGAVEAVIEPQRLEPLPKTRSNTRITESSPAPLHPLVVSQPGGPSFRIRGSEVMWDRWRLHFGVHPRRGLEVFDVSYVDGATPRPVLYRASLSELITPYGDPQFNSWYPRDAGDYGMTEYSGARASAILGADAPANAVFVPAVFANDRGRAVGIPRAVAVYERDGGVLWRHAGEGRRARQLVLSGYATVDNYDYVLNWIFGQDGAIDVQVQLTGVMNIRKAAALTDAEHAKSDKTMYGHMVAPGVIAPNHEHFFCWRLDFDVDGVSNRVVELNTANSQDVLKDNLGEWFGMQRRTLLTETGARRDVNLGSARRWLVESSGRTNPVSGPTAYALIPGENAPPFPAPSSAPRRRAAFMDHHLWVTPFDAGQMYASGEWVNLMREREGVATWSAANRSVVDRDVVLWYTFAVMHLPRPEDWPVMPAHTAGFRLVPVGFFASNPTVPHQ